MNKLFIFLLSLVIISPVFSSEEFKQEECTSIQTLEDGTIYVEYKEKTYFLHSKKGDGIILMHVFIDTNLYFIIRDYEAGSVIKVKSCIKIDLPLSLYEEFVMGTNT